MSDKNTEFNSCLLDVQSKLTELCAGFEMFRARQEEMSQDVGKIKEAVYNPDSGLYARIRELEGWKSTSSRMIWTLFTTVIGLLGAFLLKYL